MLMTDMPVKLTYKLERGRLNKGPGEASTSNPILAIQD